MNFKLTRRVTMVGLVAALAGLPAGWAVAQEVPPLEGEALVEAATAEGKLLWYTTNGLDLSQNLARRFTETYPGISVEVSRYVGAQQYQRFMEETAAGQNVVDIVNISDKPLMESLIADGLLAEWKVPSSDHFADEFRLGDSAYSVTKTIAAIIYNETKLTQEEIELLEASWLNVLDPRFKGRFAVTNQQSGLGYAGVQMMSGEDFPDDFFAQVAAQEPAIYGDLLVPIDRVVAGEHDFTFWSWDGGGVSRRDAGAPIRWIYPRPTPSFANNLFSVSAAAPHPYAARLFLNWLTSEEGAVAVQAELGGASTYEGVPDQRAFTKEDWYRPIGEIYSVDFERWESQYEEDYKPWLDALKGGQ